MTVQQPMIVHHGLPLWSELLGAAIIGAAILFGVLLVAGHSDLLPSTSTASTPSSQVISADPRWEGFTRGL